MKFRSAYSTSGHSFSPNGSKFRTKYIRLGLGQPLQENGIENVYDSIQKAVDGITVGDLIRRAKAGDPTAIGQPLDSFGDVTRLPKDFVEAHMMTCEYEAKFKSLPLKLRQEYDNNFSKFLAALSDGSLKDKLKLAKKSTAPAEPAVPALTNDELTKVRSMLGGTSNA